MWRFTQTKGAYNSCRANLVLGDMQCLQTINPQTSQNVRRPFPNDLKTSNKRTYIS